MRTGNATLIAGPTASGKSALAMEIAAAKDGVIVNTDSMQVYDVLRVLTARPSEEDERAVPHRLFGHVSPVAPYSTGAWLADVERVFDAFGPDRHLVFVGGTGLYFRALLTGLSPMPEIDEAVRTRWRYRLNEEGAPKLHRLLRTQDPEAAMTLKPGDGQRIVRALEVLEMSGKSILWWQGQQGQPLLGNEDVRRIVLDPEREVLNKRIGQRFDRMVEQGALDEVRALLDLNPDASLPAVKAIGVRELSSALEGTISLDEAIDLAKTASRQYAKRQSTWFRNQLDERWQRQKIK